MRMQLYKMELYKIFHRKIFWIGILAILGLMFVYFWFAEVGDERCVIDGRSYSGYEAVQMNKTMPEETELEDLADLFKIFGDSTRIRILFVLFETEVCVCDLAKALNMTQSAISHQLRILKQNKLVKNRREGKSIFYSLADDHVRTIINQGREHIEEN